MPSRKSTGKRRAATDDEEDDASNTDYSDAGAAPVRNKKKAAANKGKGKGKKRALQRGTDDESEEEDEGDEDDAGKGKKGGKLNDEQREELIRDIARYAIFAENAKKPWKREDLNKTILAGGKGRYFPELLPKVQKRLKDTFGMEIVLLRPKESTTSKNPAKSYVLRSTIPVQLIQKTASIDEKLFPPHGDDGPTNGVLAPLRDWNAEEGYVRDVKKEEGAAYGILGVVLALILVNGKVLGDDQLVSYLKRLRLFPTESVPITVSGAHGAKDQTVTKYIDLLKSQGYLESAKTGAPGVAAPTQPRSQRQANDGGDPALQWRWGARAEAEIGEVGVAKFISEIYEKMARVEEDGEGEEGAVVSRSKKAKTGEKLINEISRAAGEGKLAEATKSTGIEA
ncbi:MAGE family protein [Pseudohyphozyma bogoriensis]|nr:MAGE family protein [Pseudohyphozyma bogoriensis]